jgi:hypothetical protein
VLSLGLGTGLALGAGLSAVLRSKANPIRINVNDGFNRFFKAQQVQAHRLRFWHDFLSNGKQILPQRETLR